MHPEKLKHAVKAVAFITTFFFVVLWLLQPAKSGVIDLIVSQGTAGQLVPLYGQPLQDWAVWGADTDNSLTANYSKFPHGPEAQDAPINYTLGNIDHGSPLRSIGQFAVTELFGVSSEESLYAGLQHNGQGLSNNMIGEGFSLSFTPVTANTLISIWFGTHNGNALINAYGAGYNEVTQTTAFTDQNALYRADLTVTGTDVVSVDITLNSEYYPQYHSANVWASAASMQVAAVPEPATYGLLAAAAIPLFIGYRIRRKK